MIETAVEWGIRHGSCDAAMEWRRSLPEGTTQAQAWQLCQRGDWMLWCLRRIGHKSFPGPRHFAADCAQWDHNRRIARGETLRPESIACLAAVRAYLYGTGTAEQMAAAWVAACDVARAAAWVAACDVARAAARAAAGDAAWVAAWVAAVNAAGDAARAAAGDAALAWQADRLRYYVPEWPEEAGR
jgi:hypothetical protein